MATELDYMEYATDGAAQTAYVTNATSGATGGTITTSGDYTIHTFTSDGTFRPLHAGNVDYLVVAGGGAGGAGYYGGGGGGGGLLAGTDKAVTAKDYSITVGAGGTGGAGAGGDGGNSVFDDVTSTGGGGGGFYTASHGRNGGSGGGSAHNNYANGGTGTAGPPRQGYNGGSCAASTYGAGGGGAGEAGDNGVAAAANNAGGDGAASSISGASVTYAGGGGGGKDNGTGSGGAGGGGAGGKISGSVLPTAGTDALGGGGGGAGNVGVSGANGGKGVVIIRYLTATQVSLQSYSESTIKTQGSYSLKGIATTNALNKTLTRTISSPIDLTGVDDLRIDVYASRTGSNIKIGIHDSGGTTTEITPNITDANTWQTVVWDISGVSDANKDAIDSIIVTIANADSANTFYTDNFLTAEDVTVTAEPLIITTELSSVGAVILAGYGYVYEESTAGATMDVSVRTGQKVGKGVLKRKNLKYIYHMMNTHGKDITLTIYVDGVAQTPTVTINTTERKMTRIEDVPNLEGYKFDIKLTGEGLTDTDLEIYSPLALQYTTYGE